MIPDEVVERVREEADLVQIVSEFVPLKRVGNSWRGPCPFHQGTHPNFSVLPRGTYNCFVCGEKGDVFTFVEKKLGLDFVEAVKWVGVKAGVEVREVGGAAREERDAREPLWEVNAAAAEFFQRTLWEHRSGAAAREYLASRGIEREAAERFTLGYAPREPAALREHLRTLGLDDERQLAAGLLVAREEGAEPRARFRDRLMFPIHDAKGRIAGFGGRVLGDGQPKYLNSAESEIFSKRKLLYGLHWAKQGARKADRLIVVEGYFDAIRVALAGLTEVVAPLGTALTEAQAALIRKYTRNVFLLYDSDAAGQKATFRAGDELLRNGCQIRVVTLPEGEDPDTFVAASGAQGLERAIADAVDIFDRKVQILDRGGWFADLHRKRQALDKLLPTIRAAADPLLRDLYIARTSEVAGVSREMLEREIAGDERLEAERRIRSEAAARRNAEQAASDAADADAADVARRARIREAERRRNRLVEGNQAERELVRILLHQRRFLERANERIGPESFHDSVYRRIFTELSSLDENATPGEVAARFDEETIETFQELLADQGGLEHAEVTVEACCNRMQSRDDALRLAQLDREIPLASEDQKDDLIREKLRLHRELAALDQGRWKQFRRTRS